MLSADRCCVIEQRALRNVPLLHQFFVLPRLAC
eukprot:COSAG06_NODE_67577_length_251_cov_1.026316_1_plen_32_part_01